MHTSQTEHQQADRSDQLQMEKSTADKIAKAKQSRNDGLVLRAPQPKVFNNHQFPKLRHCKSANQTPSNASKLPNKLQTTDPYHSIVLNS